MQQKWKYAWLGGVAFLLGAISFGSLATEVAATKEPALQRAEPAPEMVTRLIVKPRQRSGAKLSQALEVGDASGLSIAAQARLSVMRAMSGGAHVLRLDKPVSLDEAKAIATRLRQDGSVEYAEPDRIVTPATEVVPDDPLYNGQYNKQWHYFTPSSTVRGGANLPTAWSLRVGTGVVVAVLDTGHVDHLDLASALTGYDFASYSGNGDGNGWDGDPADPGDGVEANECGYSHTKEEDSWHGLHVTGTIAATMNNKIGGTGIAPGAQILPVRVLGKCGGYMSDVADAMRWAAGMKVTNAPINSSPAQVLNLSLGAAGSCSDTFQQAVADVLAQGAIVVAASGNDAAIGVAQPANCPGVLAVTAHAIDGDHADYANIGAATVISAPGGGCGALASSCIPNNSANGLGVISTYKTNEAEKADAYASKCGTSMATPHVTGVVALMLEQESGLTNSEIKSYLQSSSVGHPEGTLCTQSRYLGLCGEGMLDAYAALQKVIHKAPTLSLDHPYQVVMPGAPVTLSGRGAADGSYEWSSADSTVPLSGTTTISGVATAYFTAPASGVYTFQLDVRRGEQTGKATATVRVSSAPSLTALSSQTVIAGNRLSFRVGASDSDGDAVAFRAVSLPDGATLSADGIFDWYSASPVGTHTLTYYAVDEAGMQSAAGAVEIQVTGGAGGGGGGGSMDWLSLLALGVLTVRWRWLRSAIAKQSCRHRER